MQTHCCSNYSISRSKHPTNYRQEMNNIKHKTVAYCKSAMVTDIINTFRGIHFSSLATIIKHAESIIITFNKQRDERRNETCNRNHRKYKNGNHVHSLPQCIAEGDLNAASYVF